MASDLSTYLPPYLPDFEVCGYDAFHGVID